MSPASSTIRVLVVDDEPLARAKIIDLLSQDATIEIVGEAGDGRAAVEAIRSEAPDLVFLDVQMPELDGFQVLAEIGADQAPGIVFVTAFDEYALKAFEVTAVDYLLKPFSRPKLERAVDRFKRNRRSPEQLKGVLRALDEGAPLDRFVIRSTGRIQIVDTPAITWIESDGNYVRLHTQDGTFLARGTLRDAQARLSAERFLRVHRSRIVNLAFVEELLPGDHGDFVLVLTGETRVRSSRAYHQQISAWLEAGCPKP